MTERHIVAPLIVALNPNWVFSTKIWLQVRVPSGSYLKNLDVESLGPVLVLDLGLCLLHEIEVNFPKTNYEE